jgi:hypothetical protein
MCVFYKFKQQSLQVLVDEESDGLGRLHVAKDGEIQSFRDGDDGGSSSGDKVSEDKSMGPCLGVRRRETVQQNGLKMAVSRALEVRLVI